MSLHASTVSKSTVDAGVDSYLRELDGAGWAWEWLRRNPHYRVLSASLGHFEAGACLPSSAGDAAARWGLHFR